MSSEQTPPNNPSHYEIERQHAQRAHDKIDAFHEYVNQAAIRASELALRNLLLINGGAAVALLTFVGHLPQPQKTAIANSLVWFASGVALAAGGTALAYFTNYFMAGVASSKLRTWEHPYVQPGPQTSMYIRLNRGFHIAAVFTAIASLAVFVCGMLEVRNALSALR